MRARERGRKGGGKGNEGTTLRESGGNGGTSTKADVLSKNSICMGRETPGAGSLCWQHWVAEAFQSRRAARSVASAGFLAYT